jgi:hypothetical protein
LKRLVIVAALGAIALSLPAAAQADGIVANCTSGGATSACSSRWYTADVTVSFILPAGSSNPQGCGNVTITSDTAGQTFTCTVSVSGTQCCRLDVTIKRDATPPTVDSIALQRGPDANGWYNHPVGVTASGNSNDLSGIAGCTAPTYAGPDSSSATVSVTCTDNAGNVSAPKSVTFQYDATAPGVSPAPSRAPDSNGWYNHGVDVAFQGSDSVSGIDSCSSGSYAGPDNASASVSGTCSDKAGNTGSATFGLKYDATPPTVSSATPDRGPDNDGWYNHALTVTFAGADATSGIASCDAPAYSKPDSAQASVSGRCRDNAGNLSAPGGFSFKFDSTPPKLGKLAVNPGDGSVAMSWTASADVARMTLTRTRTGASSPVTLYDGKRITSFTDKKAENDRHYVYALTAFDDAGNADTVKTAGNPSTPLLAPRRSAKVGAGARLRWRPVASATYYNVQLWLRGKKVLTTWPSGPSMRLPHLQRGTYTWFVWPGRGPRALHRYGPLLGKSTFVVAR